MKHTLQLLIVLVLLSILTFFTNIWMFLITIITTIIILFRLCVKIYDYFIARF